MRHASSRLALLFAGLTFRVVSSPSAHVSLEIRAKCCPTAFRQTTTAVERLKDAEPMTTTTQLDLMKRWQVTEVDAARHGDTADVARQPADGNEAAARRNRDF